MSMRIHRGRIESAIRSTDRTRRRVTAIGLMIASGLLGGIAACQSAPADKSVAPDAPLPADAAMFRLETLDLSMMEQDFGFAHAGRTVDDQPITIGGKVFEHGIGTHAVSEMTIDLHGDALRFESYVGLDDEASRMGSVVFAVYVDGEERYLSDTFGLGDAAEFVQVNLHGAQQLVLHVGAADGSIHSDHADWADAVIWVKPGGQPPIATRPDPGPDPVVARDVRPEPRIHHPRIVGATPGRPFLFRIPTTGERPLKFSAAGLPAGLTLDPDSGIITGSLQADGETAVQITVTGPAGRDTETLTIVGGTHKLALTPPMGWNSWNVWGTSVDQDKVRAAADAMVASGLADVGFRFVNIDDAWEGERDEDGRIQTNEKFPDMAVLADHCHSHGLKLGIYSSPGPQTCAGYVGSYQHELRDARQWAAWGIDLVKYDWCSYGRIAPDPNLAEMQKPYRVMRRALDQIDRDIVFSLCQYGMGEVWTWGADVGGNYWRTTGDIHDSWSSMSRIGFSQADLWKHAGPGHWNDPDMLVVGKVGWGPNLHPTKLTKNEQVTHITLWSLLASPLLIGCDMSDMDDFTLRLLTNTEVLAVNQDPLGQQAQRISQAGDLEVWARPLSDGTWAVGLFNRGRGMAGVTVTWKSLGLEGPQHVRNLWALEDEGLFEDSYTVGVARHGAIMIKVSPAE